MPTYPHFLPPTPTPTISHLALQQTKHKSTWEKKPLLVFLTLSAAKGRSCPRLQGHSAWTLKWPPDPTLVFAWRSVLKTHAGGLILSPAQIVTKKKKSITFLKAENKNPGSTSKEGFSLLQQSTSGAASPNTVSLVPLSSTCQHLVLESFSCSCLWVASFGISGITTSGPALWCLANRNTREPGIF